MKKKSTSKKHRPFNALREARNKLGLSQLELATEFDVARTTIISAEKSSPRPWMTIACLGLGSLMFVDQGVKTLSGESFSSLRERLGLTPGSLGSKLGFAESTIMTWERTAPPAWAHPAMIGLTVLSLVG